MPVNLLFLMPLFCHFKCRFLPFLMPPYIDEDFCKMKKIGVHPNENTASVFLPVDELLNIIREHGNSLEIISFS